MTDFFLQWGESPKHPIRLLLLRPPRSNVRTHCGPTSPKPPHPNPCCKWCTHWSGRSCGQQRPWGRCPVERGRQTERTETPGVRGKNQNQDTGRKQAVTEERRGDSGKKVGEEWGPGVGGKVTRPEGLQLDNMTERLPG